MISLKLTEKTNELCNAIRNNRSSFPCCVEVYLFGSCLTTSYPNDIDVLVVYNDSDCSVIDQLDKLRGLIEWVSNYPADVTALTIVEMKEINFLDRLNKNYIKVI